LSDNFNVSINNPQLKSDETIEDKKAAQEHYIKGRTEESS